jgi:DNA-binding transcriptional regulator YhcF (GntR family)
MHPYADHVALDPDDPRPPYQQLAARLRAAILTSALKPGDKLASGPRLAEQYGVARMTVQQAVRLLRDEGLVVTRAGSGVYVRARIHRPVGLRPHIEQALRARDVTIDFAGLSGETLAGVLGEPLDQVRTGALSPASLRLRALVPDPRAPWALPCADDLTDDPAFRARAARILDRSLGGTVAAIHELRDLGLIPEVHAEIRAHQAAATFKVYILNEAEVFFGYYPVVPRTVAIDGEDHAVYDLMGKDSILFHRGATDDPDSPDSQYVTSTREWFESMWTTVARVYTP